MAESRFKFRLRDHIGVPAAEDDRQFLSDCFVDTGDLDILRDCRDHRRLVVGRTGAGKTALLRRLIDSEDRAINIEPQNLALGYVSNSNILTFVSELGVKLDIFFQLLWRHVLTVEVLKHHFHIQSDSDKAGILARLRSLLKNKSHLEALAYVEEWGQSFWEETDYRVKEITTKLEEELKASVGPKLPSAHLDLSAIEKLSEEEKLEITSRAKAVINKFQIRKLSQIIDMLDSVLSDPQKRYYLVIDRLDEDWVDNEIRYKLIRALIETARHFMKVRHAKIVVALRADLIERVFRVTRDAGFQEEKYEGLALPIVWSKSQLIDLLDKRIDRLVKQRYTNKLVTHKDLLPKRRIGDKQAVDYMIGRTMMRPRDLIQFFNKCIEQAADNPEITHTMLLEAEGEYSRARLRALGDEWSADYPNLLEFAKILRNKHPSFYIEELSQQDVESFCLEIAVRGLVDDVLLSEAKQVVDLMCTVTEFIDLPPII